MYDIINPSEILLQNVEEIVITNDRMLYADYFKVIEEFSYANGGIITGNIAIQLLLNTPIDRNSFIYDIYFDDAENIARKLTSQLYQIKNEFIDNKYVYMEVAFRGKEIKIYVDTRVVAVIHAPARHQQIPITKLMGTNEVVGHFAKTVNVVPVEFLLIDMYRALYSPSNAAEWGDLYETETQLYNLVENSLQSNVLKMVSGGDATPPNKNEIVKILINYMRDSDHILIGDYVAGQNTRMQIISSMDINAIITEFTTAIAQTKQVKLNHTRAIVTADIRILKYSVFALSKQNQVHICDVYTSAAVEPIPYVDGTGEYKNIKIGNPYVLARFCLIDLWSMKLIINQSDVDGNKSKVNWSRMRIKQLLQNYKQIKKNINTAKPTALFQLRNYVGIYEDPRKTKRRLFPGYSVFFYPAISAIKK